MAGTRRGSFGKLVDAVTDKLSDLLGALAPEADAIPVPVRDEPRRPR